MQSPFISLRLTLENFLWIKPILDQVFPDKLLVFFHADEIPPIINYATKCDILYNTYEYILFIYQYFKVCI